MDSIIIPYIPETTRDPFVHCSGRMGGMDSGHLEFGFLRIYVCCSQTCRVRNIYKPRYEKCDVDSRHVMTWEHSRNIRRTDKNTCFVLVKKTRY